MNERPSRADVSAAIELIDTRLASEPHHLTLLFDRACFYEYLGNRDEARAGYDEVLVQDATHYGALIELGTLLLGDDDAAGARALFARAVAAHPNNALGHSNLAYTLLTAGELAAAKYSYEIALRLDPSLAIAHHGLAQVLEQLGEKPAAQAQARRERGLALRPITVLRYTGSQDPCRVLCLGTAATGNVATERFFDDQTFEQTALIVDYFTAGQALPAHDIIFNAIGEADLCAPQLTTAAQLIEQSAAPVINHPRAVAATGRVNNAARLAKLSGVVAPETFVVPRAELTGRSFATTLERHGFGYPFVIRTPGYHGGDHCALISSAEEMPHVLADFPGEHIVVMRFLDARGHDGYFRKYRVMIVDGELHPYHVAIARHWKVHYFSAGMSDSAEKRAEDAAFLADMPGVLGEIAMDGLQRIAETLGLDYGGVDFGLDAFGRVLLFEANATMVAVAPGKDPRWDYRRLPIEEIFSAVDRMLRRRTGLIRVHG